MRREPQPYDQALVPEYLLIVTKYRVCKLWMEGRDRLGLLLARLDQRDMDGIICVASPWSEAPFISLKRSPWKTRGAQVGYLQSPSLAMLLALSH